MKKILKRHKEKLFLKKIQTEGESNKVSTESQESFACTEGKQKHNNKKYLIIKIWFLKINK